ncbi:MAG: hypothetical protein A3A51_02645 [Candidatus Levybacteria bacterium RIFCSPLOWO2_01_FULL_39_10]|nr:MAG: hypothetical protein A3A51_02645 [Candidatus Levybacteria bacterium RIFCSPLOWO2_01_FULL_39_10]
MLKLYNTLSRKVEEFKPIHERKVGIYTCGPTVYDYMHIGNLRTFLLSDLLERVLELNGYSVTSIQNITDIDDKIIKKAKEQNVKVSNLTAEYEKYFLEDIKKLNIKDKDKMPHATEYIQKMIDYIQVLLEKGLAYKEEDGSIYFDISKFDSYGKLSGIDVSNLKSGTRILSDEYTKDDVQDFALWKAEGREEFGYDSPWGWGRPGWHIECSVMSQESLGETFDIHAGGVDLIFPHHENEIAQSEGKTGKKFVNYFVHGAHILVEGQKMSKSLGNFYTLSDIEDNGIEPLSLRYLYLQTHYRQEMNFTWEALRGAENALERLRGELASWGEAKVGCAEFEQRFKDAVSDDLNMPEALSVVWEMVRSDYPGSAKKKSLLKFDEILGLGLAEFKPEKVEVPDEVRSLIQKREQFRKSGDFSEADKIRVQIEEKGFTVEDTPTGTKIKKIKD